MSFFTNPPFQAELTFQQNLREWRARIMDGILKGVFIFWLLALVSGINNAVNSYRQNNGFYENPLQLTISVIALYLIVTALLGLVTFNRKIRYEVRAFLLLANIYVVSIIGFAFSALSGDGRVLLFAFIILTAVLFELRYSLVALGISAITYASMGWSEVSKILVIPDHHQLIATDPNAWLSGGLVLFTLTVSILISISYILNALEQMYEQTKQKAAALERLFAASQDMSASLLDSPALLKALAFHMADALKATSANIMSINMDELTFTDIAEYWSDAASPSERVSDLGRLFPMQDYATIMKAMTSGQVLTLHFDDPNLTEVEKQQFTTYGIKSMLFIPIMAHGKLIGDGEIWESRRKRNFTPAEINLVQTMASHAGSIIEKVGLYEKLERREAYFRALFENSAEGAIVLDENGFATYITPTGEKLIGHTAQELLNKYAFSFIHPDDLERAQAAFADSLQKPGQLIIVEYRILHVNRTWRRLEIFLRNLLGSPYVKGVVLNFHDITERDQAETALRASEAKFRALAENIPGTVYQFKNNPAQTPIYLNDAVEALTGYHKSDFLEGRINFSDLYHPDDHQDWPRRLNPEGDGARKTFHVTYRILHKTGVWRWVDEWGTGVVDSTGKVEYFEGVMIDISDRVQAEELLQKRATELESIAEVSAALRMAPNVDAMIPILMQHTLEAVKGNYGTIYLLERESGDFVSSGWYKMDKNRQAILQIAQPELRHKPGEGVTGLVGQSGQVYIVEDISREQKAWLLPGEKVQLRNLKSGISLPLRSREQIVGVMHILSLEKRVAADTEKRLLAAIAEMAGNAIYRATLYEQTINHADELALAYDHTLAGWARALELRDELTEGHSRRVTELTLWLAQKTGVDEAQFVHMRRGALLHDIGKMGIPDEILRKTGPLTAEETKIMQRHPLIAQEMLLPIYFLQPALDIPLYHHERWDGTGYPYKLKGEQIPLSARIFAVIDVWDALTSDRPYRPAWTKEKAREYILSLAGKNFDPRIVAIFDAEIDQQNAI